MAANSTAEHSVIGHNALDNHAGVDLALMEEVFAAYAGGAAAERGSLIPILQKAQSIYGYLPPEVVQLVARRLGISAGKVYGVATFYAQFYLERRGRHVLRVCDGTACHVKGTPGLLTAMAERYGIGPDETTDDSELSLEIVYCLGSCALAPVAVLDGRVMGRLRKETLVKALQREVGVTPEDAVIPQTARLPRFGG